MRNAKWLQYLLLAASLFFLIDGLVAGDQTVDIHIHDTYFVIGYNFIGISLGLLLLLESGLYLLLRKRLHGGLAITHIGLTLLSFLGMAYVLNNLSRRFFDLSFYHNNNKFLLVLVAIFVFGQLAFLINVVGSLFRRDLRMNR